jgi:hypothetical protein
MVSIQNKTLYYQYFRENLKYVLSTGEILSVDVIKSMHYRQKASQAIVETGVA